MTDCPEDITALCQLLGDKLMPEGRRLVTVESCTGGGVAYFLTSVAGSSEWFERGLITYSNQAKSELAGVADHLIEQYGAVSEEVANAMALGGLSHGNATDAVAITGIAGPGGGTAEKPVGTVCFAWAHRENGGQQPEVRSQRHVLAGDRHSVRIQSVIRAVTGLLEDA